jgi:HK97 gp10 family phage protein
MITLQTTGGPELLAALNQLSARVSKSVQLEALREGAAPIQRAMSALAPYEPGKPDLRDNILVANSRGRDRQETAVAVGPSRLAFYGSFFEFGTSKLPARPFMRPAFDENWQKSLKLIADDLWLSIAARGVQRSVVIAPSQVESGGGRLL